MRSINLIEFYHMTTTPLKPFWLNIRLIFLDTKKQIQEAELLLTASSLAYTTVLSIIPLLAVSFSIFHAFGGMEKLYAIIEPLIIENLTEGTSEETIQTLRRFLANAHTGVIGAGGLVGLILTSMSMLSSAENAINRVWKTSVTRHWFDRISTYWLFITLGPVAFSIAIGFVTSNELKLSQLVPSGFLFFLINTFILFCVYKMIPSRKVHTAPALFSAFLISGVLNLARFCNENYTKHLCRY